MSAVDDTQEEQGGLEPATDDASVAVEADEAAAEAPVTFTAEQLSQHLPQFEERFLAHHDPEQALALYGQRDREVQAALTRYTQGQPTEADLETLTENGYELPRYEEAAPEPLWGAPWAEPTDYASLLELANTRPDKAMEFIDKQPPNTIDQDWRQQVWEYWKQHDEGGALAYREMLLEKRFEERLEARIEERLASTREQLAPLEQMRAENEQAAISAGLTGLASLASQQVPGFEENKDGVTQVMQQYAARDGMKFFHDLLALPINDQVQYINGLTGWVAAQNRPAAEAAAAEEAAGAEAKKVAQGSARPAGGGSSTGSGMSDAKRRHLESFERLKDVDIPVR